MKQERVFKVVLEGQYLGAGDASGVAVIKPYKAEFKLQSMEAALSNIVRYLLEPKLRSMYPDFRAYRTHKIVSIDVEGPAPDRSVLNLDIESMSMNQLADFCILRGIQVDPFKCVAKKVKRGEESVSFSQLEVARETVAKKWDEKRGQSKDAERDRLAATDQDALLKLNDLQKDDAPVKMMFAPAAGTAAHTPGAPVVERVKDPVEPSAAPLPPFEPEAGSDGIE